jgi:trk system potassium uptake protein TrkH
MNPRAVLRVLGALVAAVGIAMVPSAAFAFVDHGRDLVAFLISAGASIAVGFGLMFMTRGRVDLGVKDGFAIVTFGWLAAAVFGALPFLLSGVCRHPVDAVFESMSGFTTTGATIFQDIEALPRGILFWRSMTHWLGGMGIVVLSVAVLPALGVGGMQLFRAEVPGPSADRLSPRIQNTAKILWGVYVGLSALETGLLMLGGMNYFDALCHTFGTMATGGFSTKNASIGFYHSAYIHYVITVFMFLAGANFSLHYWLLKRRVTHYVKDEEFRFYTVVAVVSILLLWLNLVVRLGEAPLRGLQLASFQAVSILTTTGFGTADFLLWGFGAQLLLFLLMFFGGCAGSTGGAIKHMRILLLGKHSIRELRRLLHRQAVFNIKFNGKRVQDEVMMNVLGFFMLYMLIFAMTTLALAAMGIDLETSAGAAAATLGNIGPGLGEVGPASTYTGLPAVAKVLLSFCMMLGRLELFTVLVVMLPMFWRRT